MIIVKIIMKIKNLNKIIVSFLIITFFSSHLLYASEIIVEDNFLEVNNNDVVSSFNESFVSGDTAQIDNEPDTIDSQVEIEEEITPDEEIYEDLPEEINEEDISTITEDLPIYNTFSLRDTTETESYINNNILEKDSVNEEDFESLRIDPYSVNVGDEIIYYSYDDKVYYYVKILSLQPFIIHYYISISKNTITNHNKYIIYEYSYYKYFIHESNKRVILSKISNSDNVSIENANLSVDNTTLETKIDRIENCIYLVIFAIACCFGGICAKGFFDKL